MSPSRDSEPPGRWWRGSWLTREDIHVLNTLTADQAKAFEPLLQQQARSNRRYREHTVPLELLAHSF